MNISFVVLIIGIIITAIAIASFSYSSYGVFEKYPNTEILLAGQTIEPLSSVEGLVEIDFSREFFLGVRANPQDQQLILSLINENGEEIITAPVEGTFFEKVSKVEPGWYKLDIASFGTEPVSVYAIITAHDMRDSFETIGELASFVVAGLVLIFPGVIMIIIGGSFIIYKKIKR